MGKKVTVFTTSTCAYCVMVKKYLDSKGVAYDVVNLEEQPQRQAEVMAKSGAMTVPVTLVQNDDLSEQVIVGFNLSKLAPAIA